MNKALIVATVFFLLIMMPLVRAETFNGYYDQFMNAPACIPDSGGCIYSSGAPSDDPFYTASCGGAGNPCDLTYDNGELKTNRHNAGSAPFNFASMPLGSTYQGASTVFTVEIDWYITRECNPSCNTQTGIIFEAGGSSITWNLDGSLGFFRVISACGTFNVDAITAGQSTSRGGHAIWLFNNATNEVTIDHGVPSIGGCTITCASCLTALKAENSVIGRSNVPQSPDTGINTYGSYGNLVIYVGDNHTFEIVDDELTGSSEFDEGLKDFASGIGFRTAQSQTLFALILIGLSEIAMALLTKWFNDGKWKIWVIHGIACCVGVVCVLLGYLEFFVLTIGIVLGTTVVSGARETFNTFKRVATFKPKRRVKVEQEPETGKPFEKIEKEKEDKEEKEEKKEPEQPEPGSPTTQEEFAQAREKNIEIDRTLTEQETQKEPEPQPEPEPTRDEDKKET